MESCSARLGMNCTVITKGHIKENKFVKSPLHFNLVCCIILSLWATSVVQQQTKPKQNKGHTQMTIKELMSRFENISDPEARWAAMSATAELCGDKVAIATTTGVQKTMTINPSPKRKYVRSFSRQTTNTHTGRGSWDWDTAGLVGKHLRNKDTGCRFLIANRFKRDGLEFVGMCPGFEQKYDMSEVKSRTAHDTIYNNGVMKPTSPCKWIIEEYGISLGRHLHANGLLRY